MAILFTILMSGKALADATGLSCVAIVGCKAVATSDGEAPEAPQGPTTTVADNGAAR